MMSLIYSKIFILFVIFHLCTSSTDKTPCQGCRDLVDGIFKVSMMLEFAVKFAGLTCNCKS